jgi:hypothetical protein
MELTGIITQVLPLQQGVTKTGTPWQKQSYVLTTDGAHARQVCYSVFNDRVTSEGALQGEQVKVQCDATSREFGGRWYTEITAWRVERYAPVASSSPAAPVVAAAPTAYAAAPTNYAAPTVAPAAPASVFVPPMPAPATYAAPAPAPAPVVASAPAVLSNPSHAAAAILAHPTTQQYAQAFDLVPVSEGEMPF